MVITFYHQLKGLLVYNYIKGRDYLYRYFFLYNKGLDCKLEVTGLVWYVLI